MFNSSIPAVWESIRKGIIGRVQGTGLKEKVFWGAFSTKSFLQRWSLPGSGLLNAIAIFLDGHLIKSIVKPLAKTRDVKVYLLKRFLTS